MITTTKRIKNILNNMYDVADVEQGFKYWFVRLLNFCLSIFEYENLPESLPSRQLELMLLLQGYATPFKDNKGRIVCIPTNIYGFDEYYTPVKATYGNPIIPSKPLYLKDFNGNRQNAVLMFNNEIHTNISYITVDGSFAGIIARYARRLADLEATENIYTVMSRTGYAPAAGDEPTKNSIKNFIHKIMLGKYDDVISDDAIISSFKKVEIGTTTKENLMSLQAARDKILEQFYRDIGIKFYNSKKAQVTELETQADEQVLLISLDDMLKTRQQGINDFNKFFGTGASVKLNPKFERNNYIGGVNDEI